MDEDAGERTSKPDKTFIFEKDVSYVTSKEIHGGLAMQQMRNDIKQSTNTQSSFDKDKQDTDVFNSGKHTKTVKILLAVILGIVLLTVIVVVVVLLTGSNDSEKALMDRVVENGTEWTFWSMWSSCSVSCGMGVTNRTRNCTRPGNIKTSDGCQGVNVEEKSCMETTCPGLYYFSFYRSTLLS